MSNIRCFNEGMKWAREMWNKKLCYSDTEFTKDALIWWGSFLEGRVENCVWKHKLKWDWSPTGKLIILRQIVSGPGLSVEAAAILVSAEGGSGRDRRSNWIGPPNEPQLSIQNVFLFLFPCLKFSHMMWGYVLLSVSCTVFLAAGFLVVCSLFLHDKKGDCVLWWEDSQARDADAS